MTIHFSPIHRLLHLERRTVEVAVDRTYTEIGVRSFGRGLFVKEPLSGAELGDKRVFHIHPGDLVVSNVFAWEGAVAVADRTHSGTIGSHRFMTWAPQRQDEADVRYLAHYFASEVGLEQLRQASPGSAGRNRTLSIKNFENINVPLPHIDEQRRIAAHLDAVEGASAQARANVDARSQLVGNVRNGSWGGERLRVGDLVDAVTRPVAVRDDHIYRLHGVRWYGQGLFVREQKLGRDLSAKTVYRVEEGDLVYNRLFAWKESFALADEVGHAFVSNEFPTFRVRQDRVLPRYLLAALLTSDFTAQVNDASTGSTPTSRNRLKEAQFLELRVDVPSIPIQEQAVRALEITDRIERLTSGSEALAQAILPAARNEVFSALR